MSAVIEATFAQTFLRKGLQNIDNYPRHLLLKVQSKETSQATHRMQCRDYVVLATLTHLTSSERLMQDSTRLSYSSECFHIVTNKDLPT